MRRSATDDAYHLLVPDPPRLQCRPQHLDIAPTQALLHLRRQAAADIVPALGDEPLLDVLGHALAAQVLDAPVQLLEAEVDGGVGEDGVEGAVYLVPGLIEEGLGVDLASGLEVLDQQPLRPARGMHVGRRLARAIRAVGVGASRAARSACSRRAAVGARRHVHDVAALAGEVVHVGGAHTAGRLALTLTLKLPS